MFDFRAPDSSRVASCPQVAASVVKELRDKTGAGMMDCKKALAENDNNMDAAVEWLRMKVRCLCHGDEDSQARRPVATAGSGPETISVACLAHAGDLD